MAVVAFDRLRMLWGGLDWQHGSNAPYSSAQTVAGGSSASAGTGNIGVRRCVLVWDRSLYTPADDDMVSHFDFLNITGGAPDDTWTNTDYTTLEGYLTTFINGYTAYLHNKVRFREFRWYRHGKGVVAPNPAERVNVLTTMIPGAASTTAMPPQVATTITFRTGVRRSWGRTYLPLQGGMDTAQGRLGTSPVTTIAGLAQSLVNSAAAADFRLVVTSIPLSAALNVEKVEVDDVLDVVRRRRWKHTVNRVVLP